MRRFSASAAALTAFSGFGLWAFGPGAATAPPTPAGDTATAARLAAREEAKCEFWIDIGRALNDGLTVEEAEGPAWQKRQAAFALADLQRDARLALIPLLGSGAYDPDLPEKEFSSTVDHPFFPLVVGRVKTFEKPTVEGLEVVTVTVLPQTKLIDDVPCATVRDVVELDGVLIEDTLDWFSRRTDGSVWYLGELALNYEDGELVGLDGSWRAGVDEAEPGVVMLGAPTPGVAYRQEFHLGEAEDVAKVVGLNETTTTPFGTFVGCVKTEEWSPLEPGHTEHKWYAPGIGHVKTVNLQTGETLVLVSVQDP